LGQVAAKLRICQRPTSTAQSGRLVSRLDQVGQPFWTDGRNSRWYLTEFLTVVMSARHRAPTCLITKSPRPRGEIVLDNLKYLPQAAQACWPAGMAPCQTGQKRLGGNRLTKPLGPCGQILSWIARLFFIP
jgi:hypothetical protein